MINILRTYNPLNIIWLVLLIIVMRLGYIIKAPDHVNFIFVESFTRSLVPVNYENLFSTPVNIFLAALLVFGQALLVNFMVNGYNLMGKPSFMPGALFIVASSMFTPFLVLSPPLICNFLVIWMLFRLFGLYKADNSKTIAYDLGIMVAVGSLIYLPFVYMVLVVWIGLMLFKPFDLRDFIASIFGYITVFFFLAVYYYLNDKLDRFFEIWLPLGTKFPVSIHISQYSYSVLIVVLVIFILSFFKLRQVFYKSFIHVRKSYQLLGLLFVIGGLAFYVKADFRLSHFLLCAVPASIFMAYYFLYATRRWLYEILFLILISSIIYFQFNTF
ncbi:DUF6427 family protein [Mucilaginibacter sp. KACC 22063]|uniref:DUF6427 family protein n=1 Tax=Mucilaginibacter sp. KACC 22063 TaxID=3025666 RepID=UPI0023659D11|nr:DUF6427 family protein [Mucilaginibacter sp. KACC 22063]WDF55086.1 DUF6427 family protein [Mucilaginibacter sp. KACC 22063]